MMRYEVCKGIKQKSLKKCQGMNGDKDQKGARRYKKCDMKK